MKTNKFYLFNNFLFRAKMVRNYVTSYYHKRLEGARNDVKQGLINPFQAGKNLQDTIKHNPTTTI